MTSSLCCSQRLAARGFLRQRVARERLGSAVRPSRANVGSGHDASRRASARPARAWRTTRRASDDAHAAWHLPEASAARGMRVETLFVLETNVDDLSPQIVAYALEQMLAAGALDAWSVAAMMKKGRMGSLLCALCDRAHVDTLCEILFQVRRRGRQTASCRTKRSRRRDVPDSPKSLFSFSFRHMRFFFFARRKPRAWASACGPAIAFPSTGRSWRSTPG